MKSSHIAALCLLGSISLARAAGPADLIRLYEEEILAHDLYVALGKLHPEIRPFQNIPHSEMRHREAMAGILKAEGIDLPKPPEGRRFISEGLDETFAKWLAEGTKSEADACRVGTRLEDHDIADLRKARTEFPKHQKIFAALESASNNHFRAFHRNLTARGGKYTPEALPEADVRKILHGENECGGGCNASCSPSAAGRGQGGNGRRWRGGR
jgi:hypothetical protein